MDNFKKCYIWITSDRSFAYFECEWKLIVRVKKKKKEKEES